MYEYRFLVCKDNKAIVDGESNIRCILLSSSTDLYFDWSDNIFKSYKNVIKISSEVEQINKDILPGMYKISIPIHLPSFSDGIFKIYISSDNLSFNKYNEIVVKDGKIFKEYLNDKFNKNFELNERLLSLLHENFVVEDTEYDKDTGILKNAVVTLYKDNKLLEHIEMYDMNCDPIDKGIFSNWSQTRKGKN